MLFDKKRYWERRRAGLRGQEDVNTFVGFIVGVTQKAVSKKAFKKNTKRAHKFASLHQ